MLALRIFWFERGTFRSVGHVAIARETKPSLKVSSDEASRQRALGATHLLACACGSAQALSFFLRLNEAAIFTELVTRTEPEAVGAGAGRCGWPEAREEVDAETCRLMVTSDESS